MSYVQWTALIIFVITYTGIIFTRLPGVNMDRPSAAFFGAVLMILTGILSFEEAVAAIDFNTIALLLGMMIIIVTLELDGFFALIAQKTTAMSENQFRLLVIIVFATGISSAFLVNDAVVLLFTPVIIRICRSSGLSPIPYLIAEILASNTGSAMTITGNPQNMLIGINSGIPYATFLFLLLPVSLIGMVIIVFVIKLLYPENFSHRDRIVFREEPRQYNYASMKFSVPVFILVTFLFFINHRIGLSIPIIALCGASLILLLGKLRPSEIIKEVDWVLLLFFASLFIVVRGIEKTGLIAGFIDAKLLTPDLRGIGILHGISLVLSQIVSNVPYTVVMLPFMKSSDSPTLWLALASASTLAGNATIIGAMANLIVIESARSLDVKIGFREFFKAGIIVTILTLVLSVFMLQTWHAAGIIG